MSLRIAVLEDDKSFADLVISWLEQAGYTVAWFSTGHKFLQALHDARYDLLIFDWLLPDMDGLEVMQHLKLMD
ncbi:MAG: response regulator, partial [Rhodocyclales bacterium]|nr:response regulator [Rhodocyclales bacterium]